MQNGVVPITSWWVLAACGRNPLVRTVDRLELLVIALAILVGLSRPPVPVRSARPSTMRAAARTPRSRRCAEAQPPRPRPPLRRVRA